MNPSLPGRNNRGYISFDDPIDVARLNQNTWLGTRDSIDRGITGRHMYFAEPIRQDYTICDTMYYDVNGKQWTWRDTEKHYLLGLDRDDHPNHFSRYGYAWCPNGYCLNQFPGKYVTPQQFLTNIQPVDVAPKRFYTYNEDGTVKGSTYVNMSQARGDRLNEHNIPFPHINQYSQINLTPDPYIFATPSGGQ